MLINETDKLTGLSDKELKTLGRLAMWAAIGECVLIIAGVYLAAGLIYARLASIDRTFFYGMFFLSLAVKTITHAIYTSYKHKLTKKGDTEHV